MSDSSEKEQLGPGKSHGFSMGASESNGHESAKALANQLPSYRGADKQPGCSAWSKPGRRGGSYASCPSTSHGIVGQQNGWKALRESTLPVGASQAPHGTVEYEVMLPTSVSLKVLSVFIRNRLKW